MAQEIETGDSEILALLEILFGTSAHRRWLCRRCQATALLLRGETLFSDERPSLDIPRKMVNAVRGRENGASPRSECQPY
jgi:hypothetical protein